MPAIPSIPDTGDGHTILIWVISVSLLSIATLFTILMKQQKQFETVLEKTSTLLGQTAELIRSNTEQLRKTEIALAEWMRNRRETDVMRSKLPTVIIDRRSPDTGIGIPG